MSQEKTVETPEQTPTDTSPSSTSPPVEVTANEFERGGLNDEGLEEDFDSFVIQEDNTPVEAPVKEPETQPAVPVVAPQVASPNQKAAAQTPSVEPVGVPQTTAPPQSSAAAAPVEGQPTTEPAKTDPAVTQPAAAEATPESTGDVNPFADLYKQVGASREVLQKAVADSIYKLSDEEVAEVQDAPQTAIPKLMARLHMNVVENVLGTIAQQLPAAVNGMLQANQRHRQYEDQFWNAWQKHGLDKNNPQHRAALAQVASAYRQLNPKADLQTTIRMVGSQMVVALGLLQPQQQSAPVAQQAPVPAAFVPAGSGTRRPVVNTEPTNPWAEANNFMLQDD